MLNIVLFEPEIPANTGNIGRTCVATNTRLHLIEPLGFRLNEKNLKRAGMDYWEHLDVTTYIDYRDFMEKTPGAKIYMATTNHRIFIRMLNMNRTVISCSEKKAQGFRKKSSVTTRKTASGFR